jgi:hypothetical protein
MPQVKKRLSLAKDCRNDYGENAKSSRKNIPRAKARGRRKFRRTTRQAIEAELGVAVDSDAVQDTAQRIRRDAWKKRRDIPLGTMIEKKKERRKRTGQSSP